jgi:hypothetical protein
LTSNPNIRYLGRLEDLATAENVADLYLWPRTPINEGIQNKIQQRVGATDYETNDSISRPATIIRFLRRLLAEGFIGSSFTVLDIACGDGIVLWQIRKSFLQAVCYGVDCNKGNFPAHLMVERAGVKLFKAYIQHLFQADPDAPFDVVLMLNTYRDWKSADLRPHEVNLPELANRWFERNCNYIFLTIERAGYEELQRRGFHIRTLGKGEDRSNLICVSKHKMPRVLIRDVLRSWGLCQYSKA